MPQFRIQHKTEYQYDSTVKRCLNEARVIPLTNAFQTCLKSRWNVYPIPTPALERDDGTGNRVIFFCVEEPHNHLRIITDCTVEVRERPAGNYMVAWDQLTVPWFVKEYTLDSPCVPLFYEFKEYVFSSFYPGRSLLDAVTELNHRIHDEFAYKPGVTSVQTSALDAFRRREGVCQDFAHVAIACLRSLGIPARYVSGYLETLPPIGQEKLRGSDATHAWFSVFDGNDWIDFDPTNRCRAAGSHITTATGRDYQDVPPVKGVVSGGGGHTLKVSVDVYRIEG